MLSLDRRYNNLHCLLWKPIANLDATRLFVFISRFCKWRALIGQHFCQAFSQKDKIAIRRFEIARLTGSRWLSSVLWDCLGDEFAAMLKMRPPKIVPQCTWKPFRLGQPCNLKVANSQSLSELVSCGRVRVVCFLIWQMVAQVMWQNVHVHSSL